MAKEKILIVDDEQDILQSMKDALEKEGCKVRAANNGAEAVDAANEINFDLILIDIMMPTLSGYDLLRLLREKLNHHVKIAYVTIVPKDEVNLEDIDGFIQKPFNIEKFIAQVKEMLNKPTKGGKK